MTMNTRNIIAVLFLTTACCLQAVGQSAEPDALTIEANTPVVEIGSRTAGRNFVRLPSLQYGIELNAQCTTGFLPKAMSLSVADTRKTLNNNDISTETTTTILTVPASQIAPVAVDGFCIADAEDQSAENDTLTITSVLSLQASLLCANETESRMTYASSGLDITLVCRAPLETSESTSN